MPDNAPVSWKEYVDLRFDLQEKAVDLARSQLEGKLEKMHEMRAQLDQQTGTFVSRETYEADSRVLDARFKIVEIRDARFDGKIAVIVFIASGLTSLVVGLILKLVVK